RILTTSLKRRTYCATYAAKTAGAIRHLGRLQTSRLHESSIRKMSVSRQEAGPIGWSQNMRLCQPIAAIVSLLGAMAANAQPATLGQPISAAELGKPQPARARGQMIDTPTL